MLYYFVEINTRWLIGIINSSPRGRYNFILCSWTLLRCHKTSMDHQWCDWVLSRHTLHHPLNLEGKVNLFTLHHSTVAQWLYASGWFLRGTIRNILMHWYDRHHPRRYHQHHSTVPHYCGWWEEGKHWRRFPNKFKQHHRPDQVSFASPVKKLILLTGESSIIAGCETGWWMNILISKHWAKWK